MFSCIAAIPRVTSSVTSAACACSSETVTLSVEVSVTATPFAVCSTMRVIEAPRSSSRRSVGEAGGTSRSCDFSTSTPVVATWCRNYTTITESSDSVRVRTPFGNVVTVRRSFS